MCAGCYLSVENLSRSTAELPFYQLGIQVEVNNINITLVEVQGVSKEVLLMIFRKGWVKFTKKNVLLVDLTF